MPRSNKAARKITSRRQDLKQRAARPTPKVSTKRCATKKRPYVSDVHAKMQMGVIQKKDPRGDRMPVRVYKCDLCNFWHLTSQPTKF